MGNRTIRQFKQLCCLGVDGQMLLPVLLSELHKLVPSYSNCFLQTNEACNFVNNYDESPDALSYAPLYLSEFLDKRDLEVQPSLRLWLRDGAGVTTTERFVYRHFYESALYHEILRPLNYHHSLVCAVKEDGRSVGLLMLHRSKADRQYTFREERMMDQLIPYIAHAMSKTNGVESLLAESDDMGVLIFDQQARLKHICPQGRRLLFMATHPVITKETLAGRANGVTIPPELTQLCKSLTGIFGNGDAAAGPPVWQHANAWGGFVFRGHPLQDPMGSTNRHVAVTVQYQEPLPLAVWRQARHLSMSPKQTEVCQWLVAGNSYDAISQRMGISRHTVIDHARKIYEKAGVSSRTELISALIRH